MAIISYTVYNCKCDTCGRKISKYWNEDIISKYSLKQIMNEQEWVEFMSGRVLCNKCYKEEFEDEE